MEERTSSRWDIVSPVSELESKELLPKKILFDLEGIRT